MTRRDRRMWSAIARALFVKTCFLLGAVATFALAGFAVFLIFAL